VANSAGDPVGVMVAGEKGVAQLPPRTRRGVIGEAARLFESVAPAGNASLAPALTLVRPTQRIVLISDFLADDDELLRAARERITAGADVLVVHIVAREELEPSHASIIAQDPEQPELKRSLVDETRGAYREAFGAWRAELARAWREAGAAYVELPDDEATDHAVRRIVSPAAAASAQARGA
jgi:uncharacterized protein (DUF58 family)